MQDDLASAATRLSALEGSIDVKRNRVIRPSGSDRERPWPSASYLVREIPPYAGVERLSDAEHGGE